MTAMPAVQTIPSPYCFCTTHDSTGWRIGAIASVRMPMVSDARIGDRQHGLLRRMADCVGDRIQTGGKRKKPEGECPPAFLLPDCHAFTFLHPGNGTSTKSSTLMLSGSTMMWLSAYMRREADCTAG